MNGYARLPRDKADRLEVLKIATQEAEIVRNYWSVGWQIGGAYMNGARHFSIRNWETGTVYVGYEGDDQGMDFRYEGVLRQYRVEMGRLLKLDMDPVPARDGYGLESVRKNAVGYAIVKGMLQGLGVMRRSEIKRRFFSQLLIYGTSALYHYRKEGNDVFGRTGVEVVPPWELLGYPARVYSEEEIMGVTRKRWVTLDSVRAIAKRRGFELGGDEEKLGVVRMPYGSSPSGEGPVRNSGLGTRPGLRTSLTTGGHEREEIYNATRGRRGANKKGKTTGREVAWVELCEHFFWGDTPGYVAGQVVRVGDVIIGSNEFTGQGLISPLHTARCIPIGRMYGRSWLSLVISLNAECEGMAENQFRNVRDLDNFGVLVVNASSGISREELTRGGKRKVLMAQTDPIAPEAPAVFQVSPHTTTDFPGKVLQMGMSMQDTEAGQGPLYSGQVPGARLESAASLGFLFESGNTGLTLTGEEIAGAFLGVYLSMLRSAKIETAKEPQTKGGMGDEEEGTGDEQQQQLVLPVLDEWMIGVSLKDDGATMSVDSNPIPDPQEVSLDIRDRVPASREKSRQEAQEMLAQGLISLPQFIVQNFREGWGFPITDRAAWETHRKTVWLMIRLFNDGKTPGKVVLAPESDHAETALELLNALMCSLEFSFAEPTVKEAFISWKDMLQQNMGAGGFPEQMGYPDEEAQVAQKQMQGAGGAQGGRPPLSVAGMGA